jgi:phage terminase large subunit
MPAQKRALQPSKPPAWRNDPCQFAKRVLGLRLWSRQEDILRAVMQHRRVAIKACHASGKSFTAAALALFWLLRYPDGKCLITGPSYEQTKHVMFGELNRMIYNAALKLPVDVNAAEIRISPNNWILLANQSTPERFQGFYGQNVLIIVDEAPSLDADVWVAIQSLLSGGDSRVLLLGNPTLSSGVFFDCFGKNAAQWKTLTIDWLSTPNFMDVHNVDDLLAMSPTDLAHVEVPGLLTREFVKNQYAEWWNGSLEASPLWAARIEGVFPSESANAVFALSWLDHARRLPERAGGRLCAGVDVAGGGSDETCVTIIEPDTGAIISESWWTNSDPRGLVVQTLNAYRDKLGTVIVDATGVGHYFAQHLRDMRFNVLPLNFGASASKPDKFANLKAELYFNLREQLRRGLVSGLSDGTAEQLATVLYSVTPNGKLAIESKSDARSRGQHSPDRAEALMLAMWMRRGAEMAQAQIEMWENQRKTYQEDNRREKFLDTLSRTSRLLLEPGTPLRLAANSIGACSVCGGAIPENSVFSMRSGLKMHNACAMGS